MALLAACGTQQAGNPPQDPGAPVNAAPARMALDQIPSAPTKGLAVGLTLPLDEFTAKPADGYAWKVAVQDQWRSCMARYGFKNFGPPQASDQAARAQADATMGRRYGVSDLDLAKKYGHHLPNDIKEPARWEPAPGAETAVFTGKGPELKGSTYAGKEVPQDGCRGEARRQFPVPQSPEAEQVGVRVFDETKTDPDVVKAFAQWSSCMKGKGYQQSHPLEDLGALGISLSTPTAGKEEIAHAVADVECKRETDLIKVWNGKETEKQRKAIEQNAPKLSQERAAKDKNAAKVAQAYTVAGNR
ncbi:MULTISPECIES: hypothetical protein [unclassified Streptomyces]|uniref:hypothetical protein n=1 Tax=unclassified Streptomyces TaxID=2593676 RepID=UPI0032530A2F